MRQTFHIDYIKKSKIFFCISLSIMLVCLILNISVFHTKVDIQFTGGTIIKYSYTGNAKENEIKKLIEETLKNTENFKGQTPEYSFSANLVTSDNDKNDKIVTVTFSGTKISTKETSSEETSETETSTAEASETETSTAEASKTEASTAETSKTETSTAEASKTEASTAETSKTETSGQTSAVVETSENSAVVPGAAMDVSEGSIAENSKSSTDEDKSSKTEEKTETAQTEDEPIITIGAEDEENDETEETITSEVSEETGKVIEKANTVGSNEDISKITKALQEKFPESNFTEVSSTSVDPSKGTNFFLKCLTAVILAAVLMIFYVALRFRKIGGLSAGVMAVVALIHDLSIVYFVFVIFRMPLNDNFIAVVLMILGYSLNDTIVIYDRIRENRRKSGPKANIGDIVNTSLNQCMIRTICTSITTIIAIGSVLVVSLMYNIDSIISFALPMMIGLISGSYSSLCIAAPLWVMWKNHQQKVKLAEKAAGKNNSKKK